MCIRDRRGWAVNHDAVVGVILRHRVPQVTDGPQVGPLSLEQIHVQVAQLVVGRQDVYKRQTQINCWRTPSPLRAQAW